MKKTLTLLVLSSALAFGQWAAIPSSSFPALDALLNGKLTFRVGAGIPALNCTQGKDVYTNSANGDMYWCSALNVWTLKGATGSQGSQGIQGIQGIQGVQGATGPGGTVIWGAIGGSIPSQTDLADALAAKQAMITGAPGIWPLTFQPTDTFSITGPITLTGTGTGVITMAHGTAPAAPAATNLALFFNSANSDHLSVKNSAGGVSDLQAAGAGCSICVVGTAVFDGTLGIANATYKGVVSGVTRGARGTYTVNFSALSAGYTVSIAACSDNVAMTGWYISGAAGVANFGATSFTFNVVEVQSAATRDSGCIAVAIFN